ncbi:zinc finger CCCH domain-containing protein 62-like isoform X2 [Corylus avellana]|uniref:zinc finger CCCH domain-containing protein 62-like isoform X2 n=1 Tax=Corylus avellana TaxID=13451 RepID=UPI00286BD441|nr:zinc finger CCCH domain-containing protein 62-like isoform X2 [Corylus avellana]
MAEIKRKRTFICVSSSEEEVEDSDNEDEEADEDEDEDDDVDDDEDKADEDDDDDEDKEDEDDDDCGGDDESLCNKVIRLLKDGGDLESLTLKDCKSYLRKHGLRLAGTKAVCIQRIKEHWRIKDGSGEAFYPKSTFVINCTGDVCKGDVVLFSQKVYERFNKVTRHGRPQGKRTVAGRVVKESYGAAKQQHTFTVEVLWSKGSNRLPPLFPLLVKGRNLYRLRTFRQRWNNESGRVKVLAEKHKRGTAARLVRAMKNTKKREPTNGGVKHQKQFHHTREEELPKIHSFYSIKDSNSHLFLMKIRC